MTDRQKIRILIVEDEEIVRMIVSDFLKMSGFTPYESESSTVALELLKKEPFDIAIVDMNMPEMSGEEFILAARKIQPEIQFIIHTGSNEYRVSENLQKIGINQAAVLYKPVEDMHIFKTIIENLLSC